MNINLEIIKIAPRTSDSQIDYNTLIFRLELRKKIDLETSKDLWVFLKALIDGGALKIMVDFRNVDYIDSAGIGVLINAAKLVRNNKGDIALANVSNDVKSIFKIINLQNFIKTYNSDVEAENSFRYIT